MSNKNDLSPAYSAYIKRKFPPRDFHVDPENIDEDLEAAIFAFLDETASGTAEESIARMEKVNSKIKMKIRWIVTNTTVAYVELLAVISLEVSGCDPIPVPLTSPLAVIFLKMQGFGSGRIKKDLPHTMLKKLLKREPGD